MSFEIVCQITSKIHLIPDNCLFSAMTSKNTNQSRSLKIIATVFTLKRLKLIFITNLLLIVSAICILLFSRYKALASLGDIKTMSALRLRVTKNETCYFDERVLRRIRFPFRGISVDVSGSFLKRVCIFNAALDHIRLTHMRTRYSKEWKNISVLENIQSINLVDDNFLQDLGNFSQVETVFLPWMNSKLRAWTSLEDTSNILVNKYFEWTADKELCQWVNSQSADKYDVVYNGTCVSDLEQSRKPKSLRLLALNSKPLHREYYWPNNGTSYPGHFYHEPPAFAFYLNIVQDCIVTPDSEIWSGNMYVACRYCKYRKNKRPPQNIDKIPLYDEVITLSQHFGSALFHKMIEIIPRLSLFIDFLKRNPKIRILASEKHGRTAEFLSILGLNKERIITGTCRAKLLYLPATTMCNYPNIPATQVISRLYRNFINEKLKAEARDKIILIRRSGKRKFTEYEAIERMVKEAAAKHNLNFTLFSDNPVPSLMKTMIMFHSAVMVIAPHGAGLSNVIFSQPGTYVIEGVCNPPYVRLCFQRLSYTLGHHWHGIHSRGCMAVVNVSVSSLKAVVENQLNNLFKKDVD